MNTRQRQQFEMFVRVREFGKGHTDRFEEGSEGSKAFATVADAAAQIVQSDKSRDAAKHQSKSAKVVARRMLSARLKAIARSARTLAKTVPGADANFQMPLRHSDVAVLQAGRRFLDGVVPVKDPLIRWGLPAGFVEELQQAVDRFEQEISSRSAGKTGAVVSRKAIASAVKRGIDAVQSLDVYVANVLGGDETAMNQWRKDRHVPKNGRNDVLPSSPAVTEGTSPAPAEASVTNDTLRRAS